MGRAPPLPGGTCGGEVKAFALGSVPPGNKPDEFAVFIRDDQAKWAKLMAALGIKPE